MVRGALCWSSLLLFTACGSAVELEVVTDECVGDAAKGRAGVCGCGVPESTCRPLLAALVHRYAFEGVGAVAIDDVGGADGSIVNTQLTDSGQLELARGELEQYVDLPNGIVSALGSATFEAWVRWAAPEPTQFWERIFDFGVSTAGEDLRLEGESYLFLAPAQPRTAYRNFATEAEVRVDAREPFPIGVKFHVAVVVDEAAHELVLYVDAVEQGRSPLTQSLGTIDDVNNWLGRSQFQQDTRFGGTFFEFRIYAAALTAAQVADSRALGETPAFLQAQAGATEP